MIARIQDYLPVARSSDSPADELSESGGDLFASRRWLKPVEEFIAAHPGASLGLAFAVGVTIAWWVKRK